ncbi:MAG: N-6 DNA methylase [Candidatus Omnitrophota bacterium]
MTENITEWEFTADAAGWINGRLADEPGLPFSEAKCEQRTKGSLKRRDLTLLDKNGVVVLTGEVKLPFQKDGGSPYNEAVVQDARQKARLAKTKYFFTWNVNDFVLWETFPSKTSPKDRKFKSWSVTIIHKPSHLEISSTKHAIDNWFRNFLREFAAILCGDIVIGTQPPDAKFIEALESFMTMPILLTRESLEEKYEKDLFKDDLDRWMRDEQGWTIYDDPEGIRDNLERAAKFACYNLVNKLVFHEALLKGHKDKMDKLSIADSIDSGENLSQQLDKFFEAAKIITGDYETIFGEDRFDMGLRIPFYADKAVPHWRALIDQIHEFDFTKLDYEVIGNIFERLISPEERHKYGQFYTRAEVVDLINSFCIRNGTEKVMDPACGGGTFLVRAYARKRALAPNRSHNDLLDDLYGMDISHFAAHLTTINLATRELVDAENYPRIARSDFFDVIAKDTFLSIPDSIKAKGLGSQPHREIVIPLLDAVIGNPPYIRQEQIRKSKKDTEKGTKEHYIDVMKRELNVRLSGRSDIHCYFWPHASTFLKEDGYLCFLTSSQWLDVEYGFRLQEWILRNFQIIAIFESWNEPWFVGARVATAATILRRCGDESVRMNNIVRFVQLRSPINEILAHDGTVKGSVEKTNIFRDEILSLKVNVATNKYRARLVRQGDLWKEGVRLGAVMKKSKDAEDEEDAIQNGGEYYGGKWGVYLRAPDLWFKLLDQYGNRFVALGDIAEVRFGVKSGKDCFFFPKDCSAECLDKYRYPFEFEDNYGVPRELVETGKVKMVLCGEGRGEVHAIESEYLEPEVHSLMEVDGFSVKPEDCSRMILLVGKKKSELKGQFVLDYIQWGEEKKYHQGSTCAYRENKDREWYDLTGHKRGSLFWPKTQKYKHVIPLNENNLQCNCNLYDIHTENDIDKYVLAGILNSSLVILSKYQFGRFAGTEGTLKTEIIDVNMMAIPDYRYGTPKLKERIARIFIKMKERKVLPLLSKRRMQELMYGDQISDCELNKLSNYSELNMSDRAELDHAVLELIGVHKKEDRESILLKLRQELAKFFEGLRKIEVLTNINKSIAKRRGKQNPQDVAERIYKEICDNDARLLLRYDDYRDKSKPDDVFLFPDEGIPQERESLFNEHGVVFVKGKKTVAVLETRFPAQDKLLILAYHSGARRYIYIPHEEEECIHVYKKFRQFVREREERLRKMIEQRTSDEELLEKIYQSLLTLLNQRR